MNLDALIAEGRRTVRRFEQDKVWTVAYGQEIEIPDLGTDHLFNIIKFLERRAARIAFLHGWGMASMQGPPEGSQAEFWYDQELEELWQQQVRDPLGWLRSTPLMKALIQEKARRVQNAGVNAARRAMNMPPYPDDEDERSYVEQLEQTLDWFVNAQPQTYKEWRRKTEIGRKLLERGASG